MLRSCGQPLLEAYDAALVDLDGVLYLDDDAVPGAPQTVEAARARGLRFAFVTNNASRTPEAVAARLRGFGVAATSEDVVTSAQAVGTLLRERLPAGAPVLVVGGEGLRAEVRAAGMRQVDGAAEQPVAVAQGFAVDVSWRELAEAAVAVRAGAVWIAANTDLTLPSSRGQLPG
ncbi:MAG: HAD-IIA family hydrolase, partial [Mycobacteriales bacterium]